MKFSDESVLLTDGVRLQIFLLIGFRSFTGIKIGADHGLGPIHLLTPGSVTYNCFIRLINSP